MQKPSGIQPEVPGATELKPEKIEQPKQKRLRKFRVIWRSGFETQHREYEDFRAKIFDKYKEIGQLNLHAGAPVHGMSELGNVYCLTEIAGIESADE